LISWSSRLVPHACGYDTFRGMEIPTGATKRPSNETVALDLG
jgi:hypothetical protein